MTFSFSCPGCEKGGFRTLMEVKEHFGRHSHSFRCPICQKCFGDDMAIIQHYQKYKRTKDGRTNTSGIIQDGSYPNQPTEGTTVTSRLSTGNDHMHSQQNLLMNFENMAHLQGEFDSTDTTFQSLPVALGETGADGNSWLGANFDSQAYPVVLHPLEQLLVLRYLRSKCHSRSRLQTEGYILGPGSVRNKQIPSKGSIPTYQFREAPPAEEQLEIIKRHAIAIDCEMVGVKDNRQTLAFISAIDFLTGDILISRYVVPSEEILDWRSKFTGITKSIMESAMLSGAAFKDWREARENLWQFADSSTVFVGQSLNYDLEVLGICHSRVVDSAILTAEAVFPSCNSSERLPRAWSLKAVSKVLLGLEIQSDDRAHSALEDAYAVRDVVIFCIRNPEELKSWAELRQKDEQAQKLKKGGHRKKGKKGSNPAQSTQSSHHRPRRYDHEYDYDVDDYEEFRLFDYARDCGWPDGWDPWSD